jgi:hypothetical protein
MPSLLLLQIQCTEAVATAAAAHSNDEHINNGNDIDGNEATLHANSSTTHRRPFGGSRAFQDWVKKHPLYGPGNPNIAPLGAIPLNHGAGGAGDASVSKCEGASTSSSTSTSSTSTVATCVLPLTPRGLGMEVGPGDALFKATRIQVYHGCTHPLVMMRVL